MYMVSVHSSVVTSSRKVTSHHGNGWHRRAVLSLANAASSTLIFKNVIGGKYQRNQEKTPTYNFPNATGNLNVCLACASVRALTFAGRAGPNIWSLGTPLANQ